MTGKIRAASTFTHDGNDLSLKVEQPDNGLENHQEAQMLLDPADLESGFTHSQEKLTYPGDKKAPTTATKKPLKANGAMAEPLKDKELPTGGQIAQIENDQDPSAGYLEKESGLPVIHNASALDLDDDEFPSDEEDEMGHEVESGTEFDDLPSVQASMDEDGEEFQDLDIGEEPMPIGDEPTDEIESSQGMAGQPNQAPTVECADFEAQEPTDEHVSLLDTDEVPDTEDSDNVAFATLASSVHVIRSNRIIASIGPAQARKLGLSDVYLTDQFQDVVAHAIDTKGLRKGLVQQGFVLAKVKLTSGRATAKVVSAKVEAKLAQRMETLAQRDRAMDQSLAIAAVGINRRFFRDFQNPLKEALIQELTQAGVRNAQRLVSASFAEHGIGYARAILTLANKIAAMPEEVRDQTSDALDLTSDKDFEHDEASTPVESDLDLDDGIEEDSGLPQDDMEDIVPASVTAALTRGPVRNRSQYPGALLSNVKDASGVMSRLFGSKPLV